MDKQSKNVKTFQSDFLIQTKTTPEMERFLMVLNRKSWACLLCGKTDKRWELFIGSANYEARTAVKTENTANKQIVPFTVEKDASPEIKRQHHQQPAANCHHTKGVTKYPCRLWENIGTYKLKDVIQPFVGDQQCSHSGALLLVCLCHWWVLTDNNHRENRVW